MADAIAGGNDIGLWAFWPANLPEKTREYWLKYETGSYWHCDEKSFLEHDVPLDNTDKTETSHGNVPQILFVARNTMPK